MGKMVAGGTATARSKDSQGFGDLREADRLSLVLLGEVGGVPPPPLGLLGVYFACCLVCCQQSGGCLCRQPQGPGAIGQTQTSVPPEIQVKLKGALSLGCLTDREVHRLCKAESNLPWLLIGCVALDTFITLSEPQLPHL